MKLRQELRIRGTLAAIRSVHSSVSAPPKEVAKRFRVDPDWQRIEDGYAARLGPRDTISVSRPAARWRHVDPSRPHHNRGLFAKGAGVGMWAGVVGAAWWLGSSRGRGPLASVAQIDRIGEALQEAVQGFEDV